MPKKKMTHRVWVDREEGKPGWVSCRIAGRSHIITADCAKFHRWTGRATGSNQGEAADMDTLQLRRGGRQESARRPLRPSNA